MPVIKSTPEEARAWIGNGIIMSVPKQETSSEQNSTELSLAQQRGVEETLAWQKHREAQRNQGARYLKTFQKAASESNDYRPMSDQDLHNLQMTDPQAYLEHLEFLVDKGDMTEEEYLRAVEVVRASTLKSHQTKND